jgi:hypothetical protein
MFVQQDEDSLLRMLGGEISEEVKSEYETRLSMFHSDGNSGPLGSLALIDMVRSLGLGGRSRKVTGVAVNWRDVATNGTVCVIADGSPGKFVGFCDHGLLAVRLDDNEFVQEFRASQVQIGVQPAPEKEPIPPRAALGDLPKEKPAKGKK